MLTSLPSQESLKEFYDCGMQINYETKKQALQAESHNLSLPATELFAHNCEYCPSVHAYNQTHKLGDVQQVSAVWVEFMGNLTS